MWTTTKTTKYGVGEFYRSTHEVPPIFRFPCPPRSGWIDLSNSRVEKRARSRAKIATVAYDNSRDFASGGRFRSSRIVSRARERSHREISLVRRRRVSVRSLRAACACVCALSACVTPFMHWSCARVVKSALDKPEPAPGPRDGILNRCSIGVLYLRECRDLTSLSYVHNNARDLGDFNISRILYDDIAVGVCDAVGVNLACTYIDSLS